ncbi:uncharacterized protein LOC116030416 [Ipomoea triloba]|uniref:uncharacterized protein LOC116030416 n=1 Tax=Ipomoea triloba TaxID=35885 RepID=UPI00125D327A|nr:uncharacterized protein LOC116030416 [Ipomoea triloba]
MGLLRGLSMLLVIWLFWLPQLGSAQLSGSALAAARSLDALLQDYAYQAFGRRPKTGLVYEGNVPSNLTGIKVSALRLRSGSLRSKGVTYNEFEMPVEVRVHPYVKRLVLVYQNLGNLSMKYYPLSGYMYLAPVLGLLAYDATNLSATNLQEWNITASDKPISIRFPDVKSVPGGSTAKCVSIDLKGSVNFSNVLSDNICTTFQQGHFSIVVESIAPSPAPVFPPPPPPAGAPKQAQAPSSEGKKSKKVGIIVGSVVGGLALLVLLAFLIVWVCKYKRKKKMQQMERASEVGEALQMTRVGSTKAPAATVTRTQPTLETEYVP